VLPEAGEIATIPQSAAIPGSWLTVVDGTVGDGSLPPAAAVVAGATGACGATGVTEAGAEAGDVPAVLPAVTVTE
jgi:hypothetical protein